MNASSRQSVLLIVAIVAVAGVGVMVTSQRWVDQRRASQAAALEHASVLMNVKRLTKPHIASLSPTAVGADVARSLVDVLRDLGLDPGLVTSQDVGEAKPVQGADAKRRLITITLDPIKPTDLARVLITWPHPPLRTVQLNHTQRSSTDDTYQVRLTLETLEAALLPQEHQP